MYLVYIGTGESFQDYIRRAAQVVLNVHDMGVSGFSTEILVVCNTLTECHSPLHLQDLCRFRKCRHNVTATKDYVSSRFRLPCYNTEILSVRHSG